MNALTFATGAAPPVVVVVVIPSLAKTSTYLDRIPPALRGDPVPDALLTGGACVDTDPPPLPTPPPPSLLLFVVVTAGITGGAPIASSAAARSLSGTLPSTHLFSFSS
jgi:hypothetical protein